MKSICHSFRSREQSTQCPSSTLTASNSTSVLNKMWMVVITILREKVICEHRIHVRHVKRFMRYRLIQSMNALKAPWRIYSVFSSNVIFHMKEDTPVLKMCL